MKKLLLLTAFLLIPLLSFAQQGTQVKLNNTITVTLDSSDATTFYFGFMGDGSGTFGLSETAFDPKDEVKTTGDLVLYGKLTASLGSGGTDSLQAYALPLGHDGYVMAGDTLWFDWDDHYTSTTETTGASGYLDFSVFSATPTLGTTAYTFWIELTGAYPPCCGFKFYFNAHEGDDSGVEDASYSMDFFVLEVY